MSRLSQNDAALVEAVLRQMAEDLAELVEVYGLGACMVRAIQKDGKLLMVGKAHARQVSGITAPEELVGVRDERKLCDG